MHIMRFTMQVDTNEVKSRRKIVSCVIFLKCQFRLICKRFYYRHWKQNPCGEEHYAPPEWSHMPRRQLIGGKKISFAGSVVRDAREPWTRYITTKINKCAPAFSAPYYHCRYLRGVSRCKNKRIVNNMCTSLSKVSLLKN